MVRDLYRRQYAAMVREQEIMKDVPGWMPGASVYYGERFV
jgi:NADH dehydrogenase (ubiquinone) 1 alpha subcomplex subunit 13